MDDKGLVVPIPGTDDDIIFEDVDGPGLGFKMTFAHKEYITVLQAAKILGIARTKMKELVETKHIEKRKVEGDKYLLLKSDIEGLI